ncbi:hypothetical protein F2Q68_00037207 [Brassica cretica]|uniref:Uncharacterized protein n=1 Tax=Brassica cretica TaxID=69181 RepID=A0A8S9GVJ4_BRACR|nr:hypothetical protein F2Q68_00037207 [Brassica cretica]
MLQFGFTMLQGLDQFRELLHRAVIKPRIPIRILATGSNFHFLHLLLGILFINLLEKLVKIVLSFAPLHIG